MSVVNVQAGETTLGTGGVPGRTEVRMSYGSLIDKKQLVKLETSRMKGWILRSVNGWLVS